MFEGDSEPKEICVEGVNDPSGFYERCSDGACPPVSGDVLYASTVYDQSCATRGYDNSAGACPGRESGYSFNAEDCASGSGSGSGTGGMGTGTGGGSSGGTVPYTFTCDQTGSSYTVDVPVDDCTEQSKAMAKAYGCNEIDNFASTCTAYYMCVGASDTEIAQACG